MKCVDCGAPLSSETVIPITTAEGSVDLTFPLHVECADARGLFEDEVRQQLTTDIEAWNDELRELP